MRDAWRFLAGAAAGTAVCLAWDRIPQSRAFALKVMSATSPTGEPEKSPLAFLEHYHWGLASIVAGRYAGRYGAFLDGFGLALIVAEAVSEKPFGIGKTGWEGVGNVIVGSFLSGLLLASIH